MEAKDVLGILGFVLGLVNFGWGLYKHITETERRKHANEMMLSGKFASLANDYQVFFDMRKTFLLVDQANTWGYARAFKVLDDNQYKTADASRQRLSTFWKDVCRLHKTHELPQGFFSVGSDWWVKAEKYIELMEPIEIANYSRLGFQGRSGAYNNPHAGRPPNRPSQLSDLEGATGLPNFMNDHFHAIWGKVNA